MKFFVVIIFCVQSLTTSLEYTCVVEPLEVEFDNVQQCLAHVDNFRYSIRENKDLYVSGFCTQKQVDAI